MEGSTCRDHAPVIWPGLASATRRSPVSIRRRNSREYSVSTGGRFVLSTADPSHRCTISVEGIVTPTQFVLALFGTPTATAVASGTIAILAAVLSILITQRFSRKESETRWQREQLEMRRQRLWEERRSAYAALLEAVETVFDRIANMPYSERTQERANAIVDELGAELRRAYFLASIFLNPEILDICGRVAVCLGEFGKTEIDESLDRMQRAIKEIRELARREFGIEPSAILATSPS